jgi:diadenosine tetraphosphate (Ap4A) HIT family hydrolase
MVILLKIYYDGLQARVKINNTKKINNNSVVFYETQHSIAVVNINPIVKGRKLFSEF